MKVLYIVFYDLLNLMKRQTRIFIIMIFSLIVSTYSSLFIYNLYIDTEQELSKQFLESSKNYTINLQGEINNQVKEKIIRVITNNGQVPKLEAFSLRGESMEEEQPITFVGSYSTVSNISLFEGRYFDKEELEQGKDVSLIAYNLLDYSMSNSHLGKNYKLGNREYKIVGVLKGDYNSLIIPYKTFLRADYPINAIHCTFSRKLTSKEIDYLKRELSSITNLYEIDMPSKVDINLVSAFIIFIFLIVSIQLFAMINIVSLFKFWLTANSKKYSIYSLCGANKSKLNFIILTESIIISIISFALGITAFNNSKPVLKLIEKNMRITLIHIFIIFVIYICTVIASIYKTAKSISDKVSIANN